VIYAGCSGYSFKEWVGEFYPPKTPAKEYLAYYATQLNSVEINHTFRRFPRLELMQTWADMTPETFRLSFKMNQSVTHRYRLKEVSRPVSDFLDNLAPLGPRLGVVLFQLPPFFKLDLDRLETFLAELPQGRRFAMEFRHESWNEPAVVDRLKEAGVALCAAELEIDVEGAEPNGVIQTAPFLYIRLRKAPPYADAEVEALRELLARASHEAEDIYLYAKHDDEGIAPSQVKRLVR
jgi:uncharacterized protein YecE (DUF72 family)